MGSSEQAASPEPERPQAGNKGQDSMLRGMNTNAWPPMTGTTSHFSPGPDPGPK
jgi:hypothetical protein